MLPVRLHFPAAQTENPLKFPEINLSFQNFHTGRLLMPNGHRLLAMGERIIFVLSRNSLPEIHPILVKYRTVCPHSPIIYLFYYSNCAEETSAPFPPHRIVEHLQSRFLVTIIRRISIVSPKGSVLITYFLNFDSTTKTNKYHTTIDIIIQFFFLNSFHFQSIQTNTI